MKAGILTLYGSTNYGGALQAYALSQQLQKLGYQVEIIQHVNDGASVSSLKKIVGIFTSYPICKLLSLVKEQIRRKKESHQEHHPEAKRQAFNAFYEEEMLYSPRLKRAELANYLSTFDVIITGSDQVWTDVYSPYLPLFFDGLETLTCKKLSYAACSVHTKVAIYNRKKLRNLLNNFTAISVRDKTTLQLTKSLRINKPVTLVCDPTMLHSFKEAIIEQEEEKYILCYVLGGAPKEGHLEALKAIKRTHGNLTVIAISTSNPEIHSHVDKVVDNAGPFEWVNLIAHAACVYTDSFHAVLFSLKFHIPFLAFYTDPVRSTRLIDIRNQYSLHQCIVPDVVSANIDKTIDWKHCDAIASEIIDKSHLYLQSTLSYK